MTTILLVEDTKDLANIIRRNLESEGYHLLWADGGLQALELHSKKNPDLIILDWMLPDINGLQVLKEIRAHAPTPVLMLTARGDEIDRVLGLEMGADDYLTKPFSMRELIARVRALLRRIKNIEKIIDNDRTPANKSIQKENLILNPQTFQVKIDDENLDLTRTEFKLLHLFLRNPERVFSRSYLLETIWESKYHPGDRSVDNAILRLRKKLSRLGDRIEAVWGVGYRWREE